MQQGREEGDIRAARGRRRGGIDKVLLCWSVGDDFVRRGALR